MKRLFLLVASSVLLVSNTQVLSENAYNRSLDNRKNFLKELRDLRLASNKKISEILAHGTRRNTVALIADFFDARNKLVEQEQCLLDLKQEDYEERFFDIELRIQEKLADQRDVVKEGLSQLDPHERALLKYECQKMLDFIIEETSDLEDREELYKECPHRRKRDIAKRGIYSVVAGGSGLICGVLAGIFYAQSSSGNGSSNPVGASAAMFVGLIKICIGGVLGAVTGWGGALGLFVVKDYIHADLDVLALLAVGTPEQLFGEL